MSLQCHLKVLSKTQHIPYCINYDSNCDIIWKKCIVHTSDFAHLEICETTGTLSRFKTFKDDKGVVILQFL